MSEADDFCHLTAPEAVISVERVPHTPPLVERSHTAPDPQLPPPPPPPPPVYCEEERRKDAWFLQGVSSWWYSCASVSAGISTPPVSSAYWHSLSWPPSTVTMAPRYTGWRRNSSPSPLEVCGEEEEKPIFNLEKTLTFFQRICLIIFVEEMSKFKVDHNV